VPFCLLDFRRPYCGCEGTSTNQVCPYGKDLSGGCRNSVIIKCCFEDCYADLDLVFLIDSSGSISFSNFKKVKAFTKRIVESFKIGESQTRVSIINYSMYAQVEISLKNGTNLTSVLKAIDDMPYLSSKFLSIFSSSNILSITRFLNLKAVQTRLMHLN